MALALLLVALALALAHGKMLLFSHLSGMYYYQMFLPFSIEFLTHCAPDLGDKQPLGN